MLEGEEMGGGEQGDSLRELSERVLGFTTPTSIQVNGILTCFEINVVHNLYITFHSSCNRVGLGSSLVQGKR